MFTLKSPSAVVLAAAVLAAALPAPAFFPPKDVRNGVAARFVGLDERMPSGAKTVPGDAKGVLAAKRNTTAPFEIRLDIANTTAAPVSGELRIWLNDDWDVAFGTQTGSLCSQTAAIQPHSTNSFFATALPKPGRVLPTLYPVHASFALPGGDPLHPIAIFEATANDGSPSPEPPDSASLPQPPRGAVAPIRLARLPGSDLTQMPGAAPRPMSESLETGAFVNRGWYAADGDIRRKGDLRV